MNNPLVHAILSPKTWVVRLLLPAVLTAFFASATTARCDGFPDDDDAVHHLTSHPERPPLPIQTRIGIDANDPNEVRAKVTLAFPHNGYRVTNWGDPEMANHRFRVDVEIENGPGTLPVVTELSHVYRLGPLPPGDYGFQVTSAGHTLAGKKFTVPEEPRPPFPASARLRVTVNDDAHVMAEVAVVFPEPGYRMLDWGVPMRRGHFFTIHAEAVRKTADRENEEHLLETRHKYHLDPGPLSPGEYELSFFLNGHGLAHTNFRVPEQHGKVKMHVRALTEPGQDHHPLQVTYWHPAGIDTDSLHNRNIRVVGQNGYDRFATLSRWDPLNTAQDGFEGGAGVVATYKVHPPGLVWTADDNGAYGVALVGDSVRSETGDAFPAQRLGGFRVDVPPQPHPQIKFESLKMVKLHTAETDPDATSYGVKLTVFVPWSHVRIDWGTVRQEGNRFGLDLAASYDGEIGQPVISRKDHTYDLGHLEPGAYQFVVHAHGSLIGAARFLINGDVLPRAKVRASDIVEASRDPHVFGIRHYSPHGMDPDSIREAGMVVRGPHDYAETAKVLAIDTYETNTGHRFTQATYSVAPPLHGWVGHYNGFYAIHAPREAIHDQAGNYLPGGRLGGFYVMIRHRPPPEKPNLDLDVTVDDDGVAFAHLTFHPGDSGWSVARWGERVHLKGLTFAARAEIGEGASIQQTNDSHTYRLGRLEAGMYGFAWYGSNGFVSRHSFRIGDDHPLPPYERWLQAAGEQATALGEEDWQDRASLRHYAFALDPADRSETNPLRTSFEIDEHGERRWVLTHPEVPEAADIVYRVDLSRDLRTWVDGTGLVRVRELRQTRDGDYRRTVEVVKQEGEFPYRFVRIRADLRHDPGGE
jgi:hypothetical protein